MELKKLIYTVSLGVLGCLSFWWFSTYLVQVGEEGLQMDYAAMYAAGQSLNEGYDPYVNNFDQASPVWDGVGYSRHSRFLYPQPVGNFFQALACLPYHLSKWVWITLSLLGLGMGIFFSGKSLGLKFTLLPTLLIGTTVMLFFPLRVMLERGQVDGMVVGLLFLGIYCLIEGGKLMRWGGALFAFAALFKLYLGALLFFLVARKNWKAVIGFMSGAALLGTLSISLNGWASVESYYFNRLPVIMQYGEKGPDETKLLTKVYAPVFQNLKSNNLSIAGERTYRPSLMEFNSMANGISLTSQIVTAIGVKVNSRVVLSLLTIVVLFIWLFQNKGSRQNDAFSVYTFWSIALVIILFGSPLTWTMSMVWLLPMVVIPLCLIGNGGWKNRPIAFTLVMAGIVFSAISDSLYSSIFSFEFNKYILAETCLFLGFLGCLKPSEIPDEKSSVNIQRKVSEAEIVTI